MSKAVFPGSFDPPTYGHLNLIERAAKIFDTLDVVVAVNCHKKNFFDDTQRVDMMTQCCRPWQNVRVIGWSGLVVNYAKEHDISVIVRGLRPLSDFAYEFELAMLNTQLDGEIETLFLPTASQYSVVRSSSIKEMAMYGADLTPMVPPLVGQAVYDRLKLLGMIS